jgi:hypothetical protein
VLVYPPLPLLLLELLYRPLDLRAGGKSPFPSLIWAKCVVAGNVTFCGEHVLATFPLADIFCNQVMTVSQTVMNLFPASSL